MATTEVMFPSAIKLVPGMLFARTQERTCDIAYLLGEFHKEAMAAGLTESQSWSVLLGASMQWLNLMSEHYANQIDEPVEAVLHKMATKAAVWGDDKAA